ncbi:MAG TPA: HD domain-containing phosphohydrolase [Candidatus Eisenbacteria bacterium]|jgi:HD-GYP domain-containing protein (c-di-GMP phosphodiesterase class II)
MDERDVDRDHAEQAEERARQFLIRLAAMLRTARTHDVSNQAFQRQLKDFLLMIASILEQADHDEVALAVAAEYLYLNGVRIRAQSSLLPVYHWLMEEFERRSLGGIRFLQGVHEAELERFFQLFLAADEPGLAERLPDAVREASIAHVVPVPAAGLDADDLLASLDQRKETGERGRAKRVFWHAVLGTRKIVHRARQTGRPDLRQAKRLVQPVVDSIMRHEYSVVGLTALRDHDEYTYAHCVNVSILSVGIGQALALPRQVLADLGVAALLHDIGKVAIPGDVLRKPASLSPEEWGLMQRHPLEGVKMMSHMSGLTPLTLDAMRVCLEHHMNFDRTGYPDIDLEWAQATLSRIVAVADCFDAITAHRSYHKRPRTAFEALQYMLGPTRVGFDPAALWGLVRTVGLYPAGSVLYLDSGHLVLSMSPNPGDVCRPNVRVLAHPHEASPVEDVVDEWTPMPAERSVIRVVRPEEHPFNTNELLAA